MHTKINLIKRIEKLVDLESWQLFLAQILKRDDSSLDYALNPHEIAQYYPKIDELSKIINEMYVDKKQHFQTALVNIYKSLHHSQENSDLIYEYLIAFNKIKLEVGSNYLQNHFLQEDLKGIMTGYLDLHIYLLATLSNMYTDDDSSILKYLDDNSDLYPDGVSAHKLLSTKLNYFRKKLDTSEFLTSLNQFFSSKVLSDKEITILNDHFFFHYFKNDFEDLVSLKNWHRSQSSISHDNVKINVTQLNRKLKDWLILDDNEYIVKHQNS